MTVAPIRLAAALALTVGIAMASPVAAQSPFSPAAYVNENIISEFEVTQRQRMLEVFRAPDASREAALSDLVDERLQLREAARRSLTVTEPELIEGQEEFAGRADLSREAFIAELQGAGVDPATFADFVRAGIAWRKVVAQQFGPSQIQVSEQDVARATSAPPEPGLRVLVNEIILPANTPQRAQQAQALAPRISSINSFDAFAAAAREYSATPSRERGGAIDWLEISELPPQIGQLILSLSPGEVTQPIPLPNALAFFQLRQIGEIAARSGPTTLEYAALYLPGGRTQATLARAAQIAASVDTCEGLETVGQVQRDTLPVAQIPQDVALELAKLDPGEISTGLTRADSETLVVLMLCNRSYRPADADEPDLGRVRNALINQRASERANTYLAELRANASIRYE
ncbi:peptidylprolyl isomerase [Palleronia sp.]|uniref:peptidylprolyl isomerase n=1 Tax=Palleronia sp. TaxID=1940284 RepID=UPI0035C81691